MGGDRSVDAVEIVAPLSEHGQRRADGGQNLAGQVLTEGLLSSRI